MGESKSENLPYYVSYMFLAKNGNTGFGSTSFKAPLANLSDVGKLRKAIYTEYLKDDIHSHKDIVILSWQSFYRGTIWERILK